MSVFLQAKNLNLGLANSKFKNLDFELAPGIFILLGPNGVGKSTLLSALNREQNFPNLFLNNESATFLTLKQFSSLQGYLPQFPLFGQYLTVQEYLEAPLQHGMLSKSEPLTAMIELFQINHLLTQAPYRLSGGEQQRIHLARFFATERLVYLLDEPFNGLDFQFQEKLMNHLLELKNKSKSVLFVHHSPGVSIENLDGIYFMKTDELSFVPIHKRSELLEQSQKTFQTEFKFLENWLLPKTPVY